MNNEEFKYHKKCKNHKCLIRFGTNDKREQYHSDECRNRNKRAIAKGLRDQVKDYFNSVYSNIRIIESLINTNPYYPVEQLKKDGVLLEFNSGIQRVPGLDHIIYYFGDYFIYPINSTVLIGKKGLNTNLINAIKDIFEKYKGPNWDKEK